MVVPPPGRERVIQELHEIHVPTRHCKDERLGKNPCVVGKPECRPGSQRVNLYQVSVKSTPRISLMIRPYCTCEKEVLVF